jgi:hypothetical protein
MLNVVGVRNRMKNQCRHLNFSKIGTGTGTAMNRYGSITLVDFRSLTKYAENLTLVKNVKKEFCIFFWNDLTTSASEAINWESYILCFLLYGSYIAWRGLSKMNLPATSLGWESNQSLTSSNILEIWKKTEMFKFGCCKAGGGGGV